MLTSTFKESEPRISPDGNLLAYMSEESGRCQIYLTRFPDGEGKWQASVEGRRYPGWSPHGDELFFLNRTLLMQVDVVTEPSVQLGTPRTLFDAAKVGVDVTGDARFEVSRDAQIRGAHPIAVGRERVRKLPSADAANAAAAGVQPIQQQHPVPADGRKRFTHVEP